MIDFIIIIVYLGVMVWVALWTGAKIKDLEDYSLAGRRLGYPLMLGSLIGATIGAASTMGKAGKAFEVGPMLFFVSMGYGLGLVLFGVVSRRLRRSGLWTIPEALKKRYGAGMELATGLAMMLAVIALFGGQIIGIGMIFSSIGESIGLTYRSSIAIAGGVLILYTLLGGLYAVAYTDMIQAMIMIVGIGLILPGFVFVQAGGWEGLSATVGTSFSSGPGPGLTPLYFISILVIDCCFCMVDPGLWQRAGAARSDGVIRNSMFVATGVYFYWAIVCVLLGVLGVSLVPDVAERFGSTDAVIPALIVTSLPPVLIGLCLTGLMAVMMSTASVALLISGTTVANDIVAPLFPGLDQRRLLLAARGTILVIGLLGLGFALFMKGIFDIILLAFAVYVSGVFVPVIAALYWKKATRQGAYVSSVVATVLVVVLYGLKIKYGLEVEPIFISLITSLVLMVAVSLATYRPETATPRLFVSGEAKDGGNGQ